MAKGRAWNARLWKRDDSDWSTVEVENYEQKIRHGVDLFLEEVEAVTIKMAGRLLNSIVQGLHHSMFHLLHGAKRLCSRFLKRYDLAGKRLVDGSPIQMARARQHHPMG